MTTPRYVVRYATCQQTLQGLHWVVDRKTDEVLSNPEPWDVAKADADARNAAVIADVDSLTGQEMAALVSQQPSGFYRICAGPAAGEFQKFIPFNPARPPYLIERRPHDWLYEVITGPGGEVVASALTLEEATRIAARFEDAPTPGRTKVAEAPAAVRALLSDHEGHVRVFDGTSGVSVYAEEKRARGLRDAQRQFVRNSSWLTE